MLAEYSEGDLKLLVDAASNASVFIWGAYTAFKDKITSLYPSVVTSYKDWFVGDNEYPAILNAHNHWKSNAIARWPSWAQAPRWFFPYKWFYDDTFRIYGQRMKKLNEMSQKILATYSWMQTSFGSSALTDYVAIYNQFSASNPAEPEKSGIQKTVDEVADKFKEAWNAMSPILKWGAIGLAAIIALSGITKKKE